MIKPRTLTHRGTVEAGGFFFDTAFLPEREARRRVLALWTPGATVYRVADGLALKLPAARAVSASAAPGTPLVRAGNLLVAAPLRGDEVTALGAPDGSLVYVRGGAARVETLGAANEEDPARWLMVDDFAVAPVESLGAPPPPPAAAVEPATFDGRTRLRGVPPAVPELAQVLEALRNPTAEASGAAPLSWWERLLARRVAPEGGAGTSAARPTRGAGSGMAPAVPSVPNPLWEALRRFRAQLALRADLTQRIGRKQAEYLVKMMEMFERGDLDAALRHALPLRDKADGGSAVPALGVPTPRTDLQIQTYQSGGGTAFGFGSEVFETLKTMYRKAFERLEREGRIEEAAFLLADLLHVSEEAVAFLEKHGRLRLAAELAEARELPPGLVVRQWFLAGETGRAVRIARATGAFADAIIRLQKSDPAAAKTMRTLWAQSLARAGEYTRAVEALWSVEEARHIARAWMERAVEAGGVGGARMLARLLTLGETESDSAAALRDRAIALLESEDRETAAERGAFTAALVAEAETPLTNALARLAVRSIGRDAGLGFRHLSANDFRKLMVHAGDAALRADAPPLPDKAPGPPLLTLAERNEIHLGADDAGTLPLYDAAFLPGGRSLVALGEAGCRLLARDGHTIAHIDAPTHRLVVADSGSHALLLAPRGDNDLWTISRLDIATRRVWRWTDAVLTAFAPDYDGSLWFVTTKGSLRSIAGRWAGRHSTFLAIDATADKFESLWQMPNISGTLRSIARTKSQASFLVHERTLVDTWGNPTEPTDQWERWTYSLPDLTLRRRGEAPFVPDNVAPSPAPGPQVSGCGHCLWLERTVPSLFNADPGFVYRLDPAPEASHSPDPTLPGGEPVLAVRSDAWAFVAVRTEAGVTGRLIGSGDARIAVQITLDGAARLSARLTDETLTVADDRGRVLVVSLADGTVLRNLRVG